MEKTSLQLNVQALARKYNIKLAILGKLIKEVRQEYPDDEMLFELHLIRAIHREWHCLMFSIYLDTSVISSLYDTRTPERLLCEKSCTDSRRIRILRG